MNTTNSTCLELQIEAPQITNQRDVATVVYKVRHEIALFDVGDGRVTYPEALELVRSMGENWRLPTHAEFCLLRQIEVTQGRHFRPTTYWSSSFDPLGYDMESGQWPLDPNSVLVLDFGTGDSFVCDTATYGWESPIKHYARAIRTFIEPFVEYRCLSEAA